VAIKDVKSYMRELNTTVMEQYENKVLRTFIQGIPGQILVLEEDLDGYMQAFANAMPSKYDESNPKNREVLKQLIRQAREEGVKVARKAHVAYVTRNPERWRVAQKKTGTGQFTELKSKIVFKRIKPKWGENVFLVQSFDSTISAVIKAISETLIDLIAKDRSAGTKGVGLAKATQALYGAQNRSLIEKGHGEESSAISQITGAALIMRLSQNSAFKQELKGAFQNNVLAEIAKQTNNQPDLADLTTYETHLNELINTFESVVTKGGKVRQDFFSVITLQDNKANSLDGKVEATLIRAVKNVFIKEYPKIAAELKASPNLKEKVTAVTIANMLKDVKVGKGKHVNISISLEAGVDEAVKTLDKVSETMTKTKFSKNKEKNARKKRQVPGTQSVGDTAPRTEQGISSVPLKDIIALNNILPQIVREHMGTPALVNRTGRFSESVKITDVQQTARGFPSIGYTYRTNPYKVFERSSGTRWSSIERDPRPLIDTSIRAAASSLAMGRFFTRRVE